MSEWIGLAILVGQAIGVFVTVFLALRKAPSEIKSTEAGAAETNARALGLSLDNYQTIVDMYGALSLKMATAEGKIIELTSDNTRLKEDVNGFPDIIRDLKNEVKSLQARLNASVDDSNRRADSLAATYQVEADTRAKVADAAAHASSPTEVKP